MPDRLIRLRYASTCLRCSGALAPRTSAWWDGELKTTRCQTCPAPTPAAPAVEPAPTTAQPRQGVAGGSAQREFERRRAKDEASVRSRYPRLGGLILALTDEPQTTTNWAKGAEGERKLGASLDSLAPAGVVALHDRLRPGTTASIDHLAVAPSGVWVIDAKRYKGQVTRKDVGGWFRPDVQLFVGRRNCTKLVTAMSTQVAAVRAALGPEWDEVPVRPMLCFVDAEWTWFAKPFELRSVMMTWPKAARELLVRPGPYGSPAVELMAARLPDRLEPAS